ncbi:helix-turn-helix transcriptional regulator [Paucihalobacter sp.]|uniref:helix-turn-helix transcriptional regulator n=1 Tax=Paucihalobacter sp. TaxID=2850405 RepID=UPI003D1611C6
MDFAIVPPLFLKILQRILYCLVLVNTLQSQMSSEAALQQYYELTEAMEQSFPEDSFETYDRKSFTAPQLERYLSQLFQRLELLPFIDGHHELKMNSFLHSGNWFMEMNLPKESIKAYKLFFDYYEKNQNKLTKNQQQELTEARLFAYSMTARNYEKLYHLDSAAAVHRHNIKITEHTNIVMYPSAINNYGLYFYWTKKDLDSALIQFHKAFNITKSQFPEHHLLGSIRDNIADVYMDQKKYMKAKPLYKMNVDFYTHSRDRSMQYNLDTARLVSAVAQYMDVSLKLNDFSEAEWAFQKMILIESDSTYQLNKKPSAKLEFLKGKEAYYRSQQNYSKAYQTLSQAETLSDSIFNLTSEINQQWQSVLNTLAIDRVKLNFRIDQVEKESKIKSQRTKLWISSLVSSIVVIVLLSLYLRRQQYLVNVKNKQLILEQSLEVKELKNKQLNDEVAAKKRDLSDFAINLNQNQEWARLLADKFAQLKETTGRARKNQIDEFEQELKNKINFDKGTLAFYERLDKLSAGFYKQLKAAYPKLTKTDIRLCSLIRLKIDSHEIATLQNISLASLNTSRYRLRSKFNLSSDENLDSFIQSL